MTKYILYLFFILTSNMAVAQTLVSGRICDQNTGDPIVGATVLASPLQGVKTAQKWTTTNEQGDYQLKLSTGKYALQFSSLGYHTHTRKIDCRKSKQEVKILLQETRTELANIEVFGKSKARKIREQAMPISVISMQELQGTVSNVSDVLSKTAGVKIRTSGGVGSAARISVRGLEGKRIGFFIDETPLSDNTDFLDINDIPIDLIERVEVYKGIVPAKFGGSAIGGAVNIVLKEYPPQYLDGSYTLQSFNTHKISTVFKRNRNKIEAGIGGFYTSSDNNYEMELPLQPGRYLVRDHDKFKKLVIGAGLTSRKWWFDEVVFEPALLFSEKEIQGIEYNIQEAKSFSDAYVFASHLEKNNFLFHGVDFDFDLAYAYTIYRFQDKAMNRYSWDGALLPPVTELGGEIGKEPNDTYNQKHTILQKINLNYLLDENNALNFNSQYNYAKGLPQDTLKDKVVGYQTNFNSTMNSWITGITYEYSSANKKITNALTAKYYFYSMQTELIDLYSISRTPESVNMKKHDFGISNAFRFRFTPQFLVKSSLGYDVRLPSENELLGDGFIIAPAANLEPERNTSFNLGFMYDVTNSKRKRFQLEINGFYMQLDNMIRFTGGPLQNVYQNFGEMQTLGVEGEVKWDATSFLYLWANATYQDLRDTREFEPGSSVSNPTKGDRMPNIPYLYANGGLELHYPNVFGGTGQNTRLFSDCSFVEEYFYDFEQSIYQERRLPRALTFNAGIEHSLNNQTVFISLQANNLTDAQVLSEFNRPQAGRNFGLKLRYIWK